MENPFRRRREPEPELTLAEKLQKAEDEAVLILHSSNAYDVEVDDKAFLSDWPEDEEVEVT